ncbi:hypothetical protein QWJ34_11120 [Saccharibacillus sp. CPCC 101409]|uniref:spr1630 family ClpXP-sensitive toxin n=1 Tax=Saccharibacillus sp. CPCC 101409 TaxID=3058041 RepID=UPI00267294E8|nr:hypothetical protein [Saccharibacillus sp. CPCC 101409]MDO3410313.1 hypothetical protein [Saccharibacillus sp. CPCC 101409]
MGYSFEEELNRQLVRGIEGGYNRYAIERSVKRQELRVSSAYAWVRGNHIDDQVSREVEDMGLDYQPAKAGYTWSYLQFVIPRMKSLLLIKNTTIIKGRKPAYELDINQADSYLVNLSRINSNINFDELKTEFQGTLQFDEIAPQHSLQDEQIKLQADFERFYMVTYAVDSESKMLSKVSLWMPEFKQGSTVEMVEIDDLSRHLGHTGIEFDTEAISALAQEPESEFSGEAEEYGYSVASKDAEKNG